MPTRASPSASAPSADPLARGRTGIRFPSRSRSAWGCGPQPAPDCMSVPPCRRQRFLERFPQRSERRRCALMASGSQPGPPADDGTGTEPDPRFTFANERTFLAWSRTALALVVAGLGIVQLLPPFPGVPAGRHLRGVPLIALGGVLAVAAYVEWGRSQRALRGGEPLPRSILPWILAATVAAIAVIAAVVVLLSTLR